MCLCVKEKKNKVADGSTDAEIALLGVSEGGKRKEMTTKWEMRHE